jgi:molecular chaperone DnaK
MSRNTINFGIDLGTTNSEIAWMNDNGEVIIFKNYLQSEFTPSVVRIDERGTVNVGRKAFERLFDDPDNTSGEFKRLMGTQSIKKFKLSNKEMTPEELSAEVLKDLKASAKDGLPQAEKINSAVITVPCNFEIVQCEATQRAAKLAGIQYSPLLQEPIAASVAYGFLEKMPKGYWVVFDLGGGTFDVAILSSRDGSLSVVDHAGDNYLGGKDYDWRIVEKIIHPILSNEYNLPNIGRTKEYQMLNAVLKNAAEEAKIELSRREETNIIIYTGEKIKDGDNKVIDINIPIKRMEFESLISNDVEKSINLFEQVLKNQGLSSDDISHLILVGGSTKIPYLRNRLKENFNIPPEYRIDPMTVVAKGAAIFAAAQLVSKEVIESERDYSKAFIKLAYNPMTNDTETPVGGKIYPKKEESLQSDLNVQIVSNSGDWDSGLLETKNNAFYTEVTLQPNRTNNYKISLLDKQGNKIEVEPNTFTITQGMDVSNAPLIRSIGVELTDGSFSKHLKKGDRLPTRGKFVYHTVKTVNPGEEKNAISIPIREGESNIADGNAHLGTLQISGSEVKRTLPEGSEIEITLSVDESRHVTAEAFSPLLDQKFSKVLVDLISPKLEPKHLEEDFKKSEADLNALNQKVNDISDEKMKNKILEDRVNKDIDEVRNDIELAKGGDPDAIEKADRRIKELKQKLNSLNSLLEWPIVLENYNKAILDCKNIIDKYGENEDSDKFTILKEDASNIIKNKDIKYLEKITEEIFSLRWSIVFRMSDFWIAAFQEIKNNPDICHDNQRKTEKLVEEGSIALQRKDYDSLKSIVVELWKFLPEIEREKIDKKISDSDIRK